MQKDFLAWKCSLSFLPFHSAHWWQQHRQCWRRIRRRSRYHYDQGKQRLTGERSGRSFNLGDAVRVQVARVDLDDKKIDLELLSSHARKKGPGNRAAAGKDKSKGKDKHRGRTGKKNRKSGPRKRR